MLPIDALYRGLTINPYGIALEGDGESLTYRALVGQVEALAAAFQQRLPQPQARIAICGANSFAHVVAILACHLSGNVWVAVSARAGNLENEALLGAVVPDLVVADEDLFDRLPDTGVPTIRLTAANGGPSSDTVAGLIAANAGRRPNRPLLDPETDLQAIKFTGGSTGRPKAVAQPYRVGVTLIGSFLATFQFRTDDCQLAAAPVSHASFVFMLPLFAVGGRNIVLPGPDPDRILDAFARRGVTTMFMPPTMIYRVMAHPKAVPGRFPGLRHLYYSAAPMPAEKIPEVQHVFPNALETLYGQTEASSICTAMTVTEMNRPDNHGSVGRASPMMRVEIMNPDGNLLPPGSEGEVVVRGGLVMRGYLGNPEATADAIRDGWLHTGDGGLIDERGYLWLKDRLRDVIISGGFNVYPTDVEGALGLHPAVYESAVFGCRDDFWGERVEAAVQLRPGNTATPGELQAFVRERLGAVKSPKIVHFVDELPRSSVGKVLRRELRSQYDTAGRRNLGGTGRQ
ncbi:MAG: long-chain fatty acid--CoA ligase [Alphaproteobacteria bacterium]|nr:long-chain fatty acid--CoA ligase [Alphaproteobacteria bacterium]